jgi:hypothetical protein
MDAVDRSLGDLRRSEMTRERMRDLENLGGGRFGAVATPSSLLQNDKWRFAFYPVAEAARWSLNDSSTILTIYHLNFNNDPVKPDKIRVNQTKSNLRASTMSGEVMRARGVRDMGMGSFRQIFDMF